MVLNLSAVENQVRTKHVETLVVPRLDEGSNPSISTKNPPLSRFGERYAMFCDCGMERRLTVLVCTSVRVKRNVLRSASTVVGLTVERLPCGDSMVENAVKVACSNVQ